MATTEPAQSRAISAEAQGIRISGLSHLALTVRDVAVTTAFYRDRLGMTVIYDGTAETPPNIKGMVGSLLLELEQQQPTVPVDAVGLLTPALTVESIDAAFEALADVRTTDASKPDELFGVRFFSVRDPDGQVVELIAFPNGEADLAAFGRRLMGIDRV